jgi:hypothetical protein
MTVPSDDEHVSKNEVPPPRAWKVENVGQFRPPGQEQSPFHIPEHVQAQIHEAMGDRRVRERRALEAETELKGGRVNYYLVHVEHPQREEQPAYQAECEDIIEALELTPNEANIFKEIWRGANKRKGNGKPGHDALYGAQKIVHYAKRILRKMELAAQQTKEKDNG